MKSIIVAMGLSMAASVTSGLELIGDPHGERGVAVLNLKEPEKTAVVLRLRESTDVPVWTLAEWDSKDGKMKMTFKLPKRVTAIVWLEDRNMWVDAGPGKHSL